MIVSIHQPNYLPYLGFFDKMKDSDVFVILDSAQYVKNDFHNRNRIKGPNGTVWLTIPIHSKDCYKLPINEVKLPCDDWSKKQLKNIKMSYQKSDFFKDHERFFEDLYSNPPGLLSDLSIGLIRYLAKSFKIDTKIVLASEVGVEHLGNSTDWLIAILKKLGATTYISGKGRVGKNHYLEEEKFAKAGIKLQFQEFVHPVYKQLYMRDGFLPYMAAIDLLFNEGANSKKMI